MEVDPETGLEMISLEEVSYHFTRDDAWMVIYDKVHDMTEYLERRSHPGGEDVMLEYLGYDATMAFRGVGHRAAENLNCLRSGYFHPELSNGGLN